MLNVEKTIKNLIGLEKTEDFENDIICAFDTTDIEVIVSSKNSDGHYEAYENLEISPIIYIKVENDKVVDAWEV